MIIRISGLWNNEENIFYKWDGKVVLLYEYFLNTNLLRKPHLRVGFIVRT